MSDDKKLLGDLTSDAIKQLRLDRIAKQFSRKSKTNKPCGCEKRKQQLNNLHKRFLDDQ